MSSFHCATGSLSMEKVGFYLFFFGTTHTSIHRLYPRDQWKRKTTNILTRGVVVRMQTQVVRRKPALGVQNWYKPYNIGIFVSIAFFTIDTRLSFYHKASAISTPRCPDTPGLAQATSSSIADTVGPSSLSSTMMRN